MQRAGIHFLTYIARARGIEVGIPPESDLFTPRFRYAVDEWTHSFRKYRARKTELEQRKRDAEAAAAQYTQGMRFLEGALDDLNYMHATWATKASHTGPERFPAAFVPEPAPAAPLVISHAEPAPVPVPVPTRAKRRR